jgi:hypothetical protein
MMVITMQLTHSQVIWRPTGLYWLALVGGRGPACGGTRLIATGGLDLATKLEIMLALPTYKKILVVLQAIFVETFFFIKSAGNTKWRGRLSTVALLINVACFYQVNNVLNIKSNKSKLVSTWRSTVLGLPLL